MNKNITQETRYLFVRSSSITPSCKKANGDVGENSLII